MGYIDIFTYYKSTFLLNYYGKISISEIENLTPYERDIYFDMTVDVKSKESKNPEGINSQYG